MCEFLLSVAIVGVMEIEPGWLQVNFMRDPLSENPEVEYVWSPTDRYLECVEGYVEFPS